MSYAELGLMTGVADPMLNFPPDTVFAPFSVIRNISSQPITVVPNLYWMSGSVPQTAKLTAMTVPPLSTQALNMAALLPQAGLANYNGSVNLVLDVTGSALPGGLLLASGSVDSKNTYVFQVAPEGVKESIAKDLSYWSTANGNDTMVTLWNPADEDQDFVLKLFYSGGHYSFPIHLPARATQMFNISELIRNQIPDANGNTIPLAIHEGSAELAGSQAENQHILVSMDAGTYNVNKAICGVYCQTCNGVVGAAIIITPIDLDVGANAQEIFDEQWNSGGQYDNTKTSSWGSNTPSVATVSAGLVNGVAVGSMTVSAQDNFYEPPFIANYCTPGYQCPDNFEPSSSTPGAVTAAIWLGACSTGTRVTSTTQTVVVGQQIALCATNNLPSDYTFISQSWTIPGTIVHGYNASTSSGSVDTNVPLDQQSTLFYWTVAANPQVVTYTLNYTDSTGHNQTAKAQATFNVEGPTSANIATSTGQVAINPGPYLAFGNNPPNIGITFTASATPPSGYSNNFLWAQLITGNTITITGSPPVTCVQITSPQNANGTGLDTQYPFATGSSTNDNPDFSLQTSYGSQVTGVTEVNDNPFTAVMYLLWSSGLPNSIPVPQGYVSWQWSGDATYSSSSQTWSLKSGSGSASPFVASNSYPTWNSYVPFSGASCH